MAETSSPLRLEILTKDLGIFAREATGLEFPIQAVRVRVASSTSASFHVVVKVVGSHFELRDRAGTLGRLFPGDVVSVIVGETRHSVRISGVHSERGTVFAAAAATATVMRSWGWNESPAIRVEVDGHAPAFEIDPVFSTNEWTVEREGV